MMSAAPTMEGYHFGTDASADLLVRTAIGERSLLVGIAGAYRHYRHNLMGYFRLCGAVNRYAG